MYSHSGMGFLIACPVPDMQQLVWSWMWVYTDKYDQLLVDFSMSLRGFITCPVGVFHWGAQVEADDPGRIGPHLVFRPVHGVLVLLASPTLHPSWHSTDTRGSASGDWTPSTLTSLDVMWSSSEGCRARTRFMNKKSNPVETNRKQCHLLWMCILKTNTRVLQRPFRTCWTPQEHFTFILTIP